MMRMSAIKAMDISPGRTVRLEPGGYHIMIMGLKRQLKEGETVPIMLEIEGLDKKVREVRADAKVRAVNSAMPDAKPGSK